MKYNFIALALLSGLSLAACAKKTDTATTDTAAVATPATATMPATTSTAMSGMKMSGNIDDDMVMMGKMMTDKLGASDANYDDRFISMMVPHHEGAVMMSKDALTKTSKPELKKLAESIIAAQNKEIADMKQWEQKWYGHAPQSSEMEMMNSQMVQELGPAGKEYEDHYIDGMIPHHESAISMAKDALTKSTHPEIKALAQSIITSQQKEIDQMKSYRKNWYGH
ncbi:MAG: DUF305 domain-containing protein [Candidatus Kapaibacterium sp.]|jgi:uncharacterized protein (DUF305 family)